MPKRKILVAATEAGHNLARKALSKKYDLKLVSTLSEAQAALTLSEIALPERRSSFDLVICSVHFDDSRMFELLEHVRKVDHYDKLPFLVITVMPTVVPVDSSIKAGAEALGAYGFLDLHLLPQEEAGKILLRTVEEGFGKPVKEERVDKDAPKKE